MAGLKATREQRTVHGVLFIGFYLVGIALLWSNSTWVECSRQSRYSAASLAVLQKVVMRKGRIV